MLCVVHLSWRPPSAYDGIANASPLLHPLITMQATQLPTSQILRPAASWLHRGASDTSSMVAYSAAVVSTLECRRRRRAVRRLLPPARRP
jgi:hypothetical protein